MAVQCGEQTRLIRMDILDRDMFDPAPKTPEHTSWTMALLGRLDQTIGPGVMERPVFTFAEQPPARSGELKSTEFARLSSGAFDVLFPKAPHKPSDLYLLSQAPPPAPPTVEILRTSPLSPVSSPTPKYPPLARMARIAGQVVFALDVTSDGDVSSLRSLSGHPLLLKAVESEVSKWKFPPGVPGRQVDGVMEFKINCHSARP